MPSTKKNTGKATKSIACFRDFWREGKSCPRSLLAWVIVGTPKGVPSTHRMVARSLLSCAIVGTPKGVPSTHWMILAAADAFYKRAEKQEQTDGEHCMFSSFLGAKANHVCRQIMVARLLRAWVIVRTPKGVPSTHRMVFAATNSFYERAEKHEQTDGEQCPFSCFLTRRQIVYVYKSWKHVHFSGVPL